MFQTTNQSKLIDLRNCGQANFVRTSIPINLDWGPWKTRQIQAPIPCKACL